MSVRVRDLGFRSLACPPVVTRTGLSDPATHGSALATLWRMMLRLVAAYRLPRYVRSSVTKLCPAVTRCVPTSRSLAVGARCRAIQQLPLLPVARTLPSRRCNRNLADPRLRCGECVRLPRNVRITPAWVTTTAQPSSTSAAISFIARCTRVQKSAKCSPPGAWNEG